MQFGIAVGIMLLGSWVLNTPVPEPSQDAAAMQAESGFTRPKPIRNMVSGGGTRPSQSPREGRPVTREEIERAKEMQRQMKSAESGVIQPGMTRPLPIAPTEFAQPGTLGLPAWPTPPTSAGPAAAAAAPEQNARMQLPSYRRGTLPPLNQASYAAMDQQRDLAGSTAFRSFTPVAGPEKIFAGSQVTTSGVSPYLQLFRNDTAGGTIDNYSTLVRPALQQQRLNQQFGADLFGVQRDQRIQQSSLQRFQTSVRTLQGVSTPQFNMNGNAYPGYANPGGYGNLGYGTPGTPGYGGQGYGP